MLLRWLSASILTLLLAGTVTANPLQFAPVAELLQGQVPLQSGLQLDLPSVSEDGSAVPMSVRFDGSLAEDDRLVALYLFATGNPRPEIMSFHLASGQVLPDFSSRIRLNESQSVIALAVSEQGRAWLTERDVRVTISGCLMRSDEPEGGLVQMQNPRIALPRRVAANQPLEIRTLINHPMETGLRPGADGALVPRNLIRHLQLAINDQPALEVRFHNGTSANPYVRLLLQLEQSSDLTFRWQDQQGREIAEQRQLTF